MAIISPQKLKTKSRLELEIRSYQAEDVKAYQHFAKAVASETTHTLKYEGMTVASAERLISLWSQTAIHPTDVHLGVFQNQTLVANLRLFQRNETHPWIRHIASFGMAVRKDFWGQGIGSALLNAMLIHARSTEISRIEAEVRCENESGVRLYLKHGFEIEGTRRKAALINNQLVDEYYIAALLD